MIKQRVPAGTGGGAGNPNEPTSFESIWYTDSTVANAFRNFVEIGPIPFPVQSGKGMSTYDSTITYGDGYGTGNQTMQGVAQGVLSYSNGPNAGTQGGTPKCVRRSAI